MDLPATIAEAGCNPLLAACVAACTDCHRTLRGFALDAAEAAPGTVADRALWRLMPDCAEVCEAAASNARCGSVLLPAVAEACVRLCDECAAACEGQTSAPAIEACAEACRRCARACFALGRRPAGSASIARAASA